MTDDTEVAAGRLKLGGILLWFLLSKVENLLFGNVWVWPPGGILSCLPHPLTH